MKLIDCLNQFPDDRLFEVAHEENPRYRIRSIAQIKADLAPSDLEESFFEVRSDGKSIGVIGGVTLYTESPK